MAIKIEHDASGKVTGVVYADEDRQAQCSGRRRASVAVAGNSIESPRLLLNSASTMYPDGMANSSGQVGRNYLRHMTGSVYAAFDKSVHMLSRHHHGRHHPRRGHQRSEARLRRWLRNGNAVARPALHGGVPQAGRPLGRSFTSAMESYPRMAGMWLVGEDMAQETNRITLDPVAKDKFGMPVARCISTIIPTTSRCAPMPTSRAPRVRGGRRHRDLSDPALSEYAQSRHQPDEREAERTAW